jgi:rubrerythrin
MGRGQQARRRWSAAFLSRFVAQGITAVRRGRVRAQSPLEVEDMSEELQALFGRNKTGVARSTERRHQMLEADVGAAPGPELPVASVGQVRKQYADEREPMGTLAPPASLQQMGVSTLAKLKGGNPTLFLDKISARLASERMGTRFYEAVLSKFDSFGTFAGGPTRADLEAAMNDELEHFAMLVRAVETLGADVTVLSTSAALEGVALGGVLALLIEPRTNLAQCLEAILIAELADNDLWDTLIELAQDAGQQQMVADFSRARDDERRHLANTRKWLDAIRAA